MRLWSRIKGILFYSYKIPKQESEKVKRSRRKNIAALIATGNISLQRKKFITEKEVEEKKRNVLSYDL